MLPSIHDQKTQLRQRCKAMRKSLGEETRRQASSAIRAHISAWDIFQQAEAILTYMPIHGEVDLHPLLTGFPEKRWLLPRMLPGEFGRMVFHPFDPDNLIVHSFGMAEPAQHLLQVPADEIQLVLAPGLAFDRNGWRLGYGGGYFDRFLKDFKGVSAGVVYRDLLLNTIPHGRYDIPMGWLVTEDGLIEVTGSK
ncbi:MAG: 5-formyltetrahydrofolate cyclo-ligase [Anaerolineales bacterium]|jgi:5-formyltetrahydrofolate cyclo-ligase